MFTNGPFKPTNRLFGESLKNRRNFHVDIVLKIKSNIRDIIDIKPRRSDTRNFAAIPLYPLSIEASASSSLYDIASYLLERDQTGSVHFGRRDCGVLGISNGRLHVEWVHRRIWKTTTRTADEQESSS